MLNLKRYRLRASSCPDIYRNSMTTIAQEKSQWGAGLWDFWDLIVDMFDFSHFADPKFLVFALSNFLLYTWYDVPYVYLTDNANMLGYPENEASILISIIGIINMVGEVSLPNFSHYFNHRALYSIYTYLPVYTGDRFRTKPCKPKFWIFYVKIV